MDVHLLYFRQSSHSIERRSSSVAYLVVGASQEKMEWGRVFDSRRWLTALGAEGERWDLE